MVEDAGIQAGLRTGQPAALSLDRFLLWERRRRAGGAAPIVLALYTLHPTCSEGTRVYDSRFIV